MLSSRKIDLVATTGERHPHSVKMSFPKGLEQHLETHLGVLDYEGVTQRTLDNARDRIQIFFRFLETKGIDKIEDVNEAVIDAYQDHLYYCPGRNGNGMSKWTQISYLSSS